MPTLKPNLNAVESLLSRRVSEVIDAQHLRASILSGKKLRVKLGIDPTGAELHLGHAVPLMKLREFQEAGHTAVLIIGDWTARIGDPSGKDETRPSLTEKQVKANAKDFEKQAYLILDKKKTEVRYQSEWFAKFKLADVIHLMSLMSVGQTLSHETFRKRLESKQPFSLHEMLYPLLQGYDSVAVKADVELGALEQKFNVLAGRLVQKAFGQEPQDVMLMPYLIGLDGKEKMSKTLGNYIALRDTANEMFGKVMSLPDGLMLQYYELCTSVSSDQTAQIKQQLTEGQINPRTIKALLASKIVTLYHGDKSAIEAEKNFEKKFGKDKNITDLKPDMVLKKRPGKYLLNDLLVEARLVSSKSEARRKRQEGAVRKNGIKLSENEREDYIEILSGDLISLGKRFLRIE